MGKQRKQRKQHTQRKRTNMRQRTQRHRRRQGGGMPTLNPAPTDYSLAADSPAALSREQGEQFQNMTKAFHGGAVFVGAPFGEGDSATLSQAQAAAAGVSSLNDAMAQIRDMRDPGVVGPTLTATPGQAGGRRRRHHKASRKSRKGRKHHKASRKGRKGRKASRKGRKSRKAYRRRQNGGGVNFAENAGLYNANAKDGMLLDNYSGAGLNVEWAAVSAAKGGDYLEPNAS
jgi:hypothetical protein